MTEAQAALLIMVATIVRQQIGPSSELGKQLHVAIEEMASELDRFGIRAPASQWPPRDKL